MKTYRPTWAEIDLGNLAFNFRQMKKLAGMKVKMLAAVKANAYGHGMVEVSRKLQKCGVDYLGVASVDEAVILRKANITAPILVLGPAFSSQEMKSAAALGITLTVADYSAALKLHRIAGSRRKIKVHIKIDTGMGRLGIWHEKAETIIRKISRLKNIFIEGIYTHFPSADTDRRFTKSQVLHFAALLAALNKQGISIALAHAANSIAVCRRLCPSFLNMVRPGIMLYGLSGRDKVQHMVRLKPVLALKSRVVFIKETPPGRSISYGRTYITKNKTRIVTLPIGYADGYARALSNRAKVIIHGKFYPVAGRICMDQTMVDVGLRTKVKTGDPVTLIGTQQAKTIRAEQLARICATIPYEITCRISSRVPRVFKNY
ncbi:MAG: alanine racemase [Candidatus Omnitrophica bacterium]|nr:alanine racemase [Candidatus Omnitrophota bacterium]MCG2703020.1 alanine racemase [Candidatus Omnitrophota bacterium]